MHVLETGNFILAELTNVQNIMHLLVYISYSVLLLKSRNVKFSKYLIYCCTFHKIIFLNLIESLTVKCHFILNEEVCWLLCMFTYLPTAVDQLITPPPPWGTGQPNQVNKQTWQSHLGLSCSSPNIINCRSTHSKFETASKYQNKKFLQCSKEPRAQYQCKIFSVQSHSFRKRFNQKC